MRFAPKDQILEEGKREYSFGFTSANDIRSLPGLTEDAETERISLKYRKGLPQNRELGIEIPVLVRSGGFMDPIIEWWHEHVVGLNYYRKDVPYGRSEIIYPGSSRFGSAGGIGDVSFNLSQKLDKEWIFTLGAKLPTGNAKQLLGSGAIDAGVSLYYRRQFAPSWVVYGQAGIIAQGRATKLSGTRGLVDQESLTLGYRANSRDGYTVQWQSERSALSMGIGGSDATHRLLSFGYERKLGENRSLQAYFSEDGDFLSISPEVSNIGPDFTFGLSYRVRF